MDKVLLIFISVTFYSSIIGNLIFRNFFKKHNLRIQKNVIALIEKAIIKSEV
ncbi:hypothetical protein FD00_GL002420 [Liquorilactobacillus mali KCTC 3596 = DSM 20444]|uniref:Uncharacterized protein n=1 Tax=Liquorilactobacillus mali KCTC 3596 = DSM 20444 TaxID=1046596 RepID=A0A0R2DVN2_9LACO|nr:hypothetical protein FD00_GL002420 [Liquorilactobacillus mali KCTC 3596 = DSM 20444]